MSIMPNETGKGYAKYLTPDIVDVQTLTFEIYNVNDPEIEKTMTKMK